MSAYLPVDLDAVRITGSIACVPPVGVTIEGVLAFRVEPSGAAVASPGTELDGDTGVGVDLLQATTVARVAAAVQTRTFRIIR
jgi:hypothetical protein